MNVLNHKLLKIKKVFNTNVILKTITNKDSIAKYYSVNRLAYSILQSVSGYLHMGISSGDKFRKEDLLEQAKFIESYVNQLEDGSKILELAAGRGVNSLYLAKNHPKKNFSAVDITDSQLVYAYKNAKKVHNLLVTKADYHNLDSFKQSSIDVVFVIEALCHSSDKKKVLNEAYRILKPKGLFIVIDGYLNKVESKLNDEELLANRLTEIGMAVPKFEHYGEFIRKTSSTGYEVIKEKDVSKQVLPSMYRLERYAKAYFKFPSLGKLICRTLPKEFIYNSLSGYLMPTLIENEIACYMITVLRKV